MRLNFWGVMNIHSISVHFCLRRWRKRFCATWQNWCPTEACVWRLPNCQNSQILNTSSKPTVFSIMNHNFIGSWTDFSKKYAPWIYNPPFNQRTTCWREFSPLGVYENFKTWQRKGWHLLTGSWSKIGACSLEVQVCQQWSLSTETPWWPQLSSEPRFAVCPGCGDVEILNSRQKTQPLMEFGFKLYLQILPYLAVPPQKILLTEKQTTQLESNHTSEARLNIAKKNPTVTPSSDGRFLDGKTCWKFSSSWLTTNSFRGSSLALDNWALLGLSMIISSNSHLYKKSTSSSISPSPKNQQPSLKKRKRYRLIIHILSHLKSHLISILFQFPIISYHFPSLFQSTSTCDLWPVTFQFQSTHPREPAGTGPGAVGFAVAWSHSRRRSCSRAAALLLGDSPASSEEILGTSNIQTFPFLSVKVSEPAKEKRFKTKTVFFKNNRCF